MKPLLNGAVVAEQVEGRKVTRHPSMAYVWYDSHVLHPKALVVTNDGYMQFYIKNAYLDIIRLLLNELNVEYVVSTNTTSIKVYDSDENLVKLISKFHEVLLKVAHFDKEDVK